jgi:hypothetical protein
MQMKFLFVRHLVCEMISVCMNKFYTYWYILLLWLPQVTLLSSRLHSYTEILLKNMVIVRGYNNDNGRGNVWWLKGKYVWVGKIRRDETQSHIKGKGKHEFPNYSK